MNPDLLTVALIGKGRSLLWVPWAHPIHTSPSLLSVIATTSPIKWRLHHVRGRVSLHPPSLIRSEPSITLVGPPFRMDVPDSATCDVFPQSRMNLGFRRRWCPFSPDSRAHKSGRSHGHVLPSAASCALVPYACLVDYANPRGDAPLFTPAPV